MDNKAELSQKCREYFSDLMMRSYEADNPIKVILDKYDKNNPGLDSFELKSIQYEIIAENVELIIFDETPFYFINNMTACAGLYNGSVADWLYRRNKHIYIDADPKTWRRYSKLGELRAHLCYSPYCDVVHYTVAVENLVKYGMKKYYIDAENAKKDANDDELKFLNCAQRGLLSAKRICERYAKLAQKRLMSVEEKSKRKNLELLYESALRCPWEAPQTFFEGLNTCWFARNVIGALDGMGNSTLGRVDYILYDLYKKDIESGILTKDEAYELIKDFLILGDMQYDKNTSVISGNDHELEMGIGLGGCDRHGRRVYNELTSMFIQAHSELGCIFPKIHARFSFDSPNEYLAELSEQYLKGISTIGLSCDDGIIPALINCEKTVEDARSYETVGCWENKVCSKESYGAGNYVYAVTLLEQAVYGPEKDYIDAGLCCTSLDNAKNFEDVYDILSSNLINFVRWRCLCIGKYGKLAPLVNPLCLTSSLMDGCIESKKDYTQGGSKYKPNSCDISGFANYVDAMIAIKTLCFDEKIITLPKFLDVVRNNCENNEELLNKVRKCNHFCDNEPCSNEISLRLHRDLYNALKDIENEHGGKFFLNYCVYREFIQLAKFMRATPDGRKNGDMFAQGIGPSKYHTADSLGDILASHANLDTEKCVTSCLDIVLPSGEITTDNLVLLLRTFASMKVKHLQLNCLSKEELIRAQKYPSEYENLIVRVTGFSAKFISLSKEFQDEIISRQIH